MSVPTVHEACEYLLLVSAGGRREFAEILRSVNMPAIEVEMVRLAEQWPGMFRLPKG